MAQVLPPGWEQGQTPDGRAYFVNHATKETTWNRPPAYSAAPPTGPAMPSAPVQQRQQQQQPTAPVVIVGVGPPPAYSGGQPPAYSGGGFTQGLNPVACYKPFWVAVGLGWVVWIFSVSATVATNWYCQDDACGGMYLEDYCEDNDWHGCDKADGLIIAQTFATVVVSVTVILFSVAWCRPFDAGCCSSKNLGLSGGIFMVVYDILQLTAFSLAAAFTEAVNEEYVGDEVTNGGAFDVAVTSFVLGLVLAIVVLSLFRRAGDGPWTGRCGGSNGLPVRAPREQQPTKQQFTTGV